MIPRLYLDVPLAEGGVAPLPETQAHYLRTVLRRQSGEKLLVFNARDGEFEAELQTPGKRAAVAALGRRTRAAPAVGSAPDVWLVFAGVKRAASEMIVQKGTELGVVRFLPTLTERTNRERVNEDRLRAIAVEAAEQSLRLTVPEILPAAALSTVLSDWPSGRRLIFCDEAGDEPDALWGGIAGRAAPIRNVLDRQSPGPAAVLIGPEGGFTSAERTTLRALSFVTPVTLGPRILRADTAAIVALAVWQSHHGDLNQM